MAKQESTSLMVSDDLIRKKILYLRGQKVMLDSDLAEFYGIETKRLKEQVRRNLQRFEGYAFQLSKEEADRSRSQIASLNRGGNLKYLPFAFTEHGVLMLANVLKSTRAIAVSRRLIEIFIELRESMLDRAQIKLDIEEIKKTLKNQGKNMEILFRYIDELVEKPEKPTARKQIGFAIGKKSKST